MRAITQFWLLALLTVPIQHAEHRPKLRKQPKQARSRETVAIMVEAGARILEARGLGGFSTNAVADHAGFGIGSLYQYFPSKEALISALIVREKAILIAHAEAARAQPTGKSALSALVDAALVHQFRRPVLSRILDLEEARLPLDLVTQQAGEQLRDVVLEILRRPDLPYQDNYDFAAQDVMAIVKGMVDAASMRAEIDVPALSLRIRKVVFRFLDINL
jgi:AcrR family transcriptional regulator